MAACSGHAVKSHLTKEGACSHSLLARLPPRPTLLDLPPEYRDLSAIADAPSDLLDSTGLHLCNLLALELLLVYTHKIL